MRFRAVGNRTSGRRQRHRCRPPPDGPRTASRGGGGRPAAPAREDGLVLTVTARRACWIGSTLDGGQRLEKMLAANETIMLRATSEAVLRIGDAWAISVLINNQPTRPLGATGQVVTHRITKANYRNLVGKLGFQVIVRVNYQENLGIFGSVFSTVNPNILRILNPQIPAPYNPPMLASTFEVLRCPYCGGRLELVTSSFHRLEGDEIADGIIACHCCVFPVIDGIPVMHLERAAPAAKDHIEAGHYRSRAPHGC